MNIIMAYLCTVAASIADAASNGQNGPNANANADANADADDESGTSVIVKVSPEFTCEISGDEVSPVVTREATYEAALM